MNRREFLKRGVIAGVVAAFSPEAFASALTQGQGRKTLILGGSAFALGYALSHPEETVVLERGILLAPEFSATGDYAEPGAAKSPLGPGQGSARRFHKTEPTIWHGEDLDLPTYLRRNINLDL